MTIFPAPFLGWNGAFKGLARYAAMSVQFFSTSPFLVKLNFRISGDGKTWHKRAIGGDLTEIGIFQPVKMVRFGARLIVIGKNWDNGNNARAAIYWSDNAVDWWHATTPIDGPAGTSGNREFVGIAVHADQLVVLSNTGERTVSSDGVSWTGYGDPGFAGVLASGIAASDTALVAIGSGGKGFRATTPAGPWSAVDLKLGTPQTPKLATGDVFVALGTGVISTSPLTSGSVWTPRVDPLGGGWDWAGYAAGRWLAAGLNGKWITSINSGASWSMPSQKPNSNNERVYSGFWDEDKWLVFMNSGIAAISEDGLTWRKSNKTGLAAASYPAVASLA